MMNNLIEHIPDSPSSVHSTASSFATITANKPHDANELCSTQKDLYINDIVYNPYWKESESILMYKSRDFAFNANVVIMNLDDFLKPYTYRNFYTDYYIKKNMIMGDELDFSRTEDGQITSYKFEDKAIFSKLKNRGISLVILANQLLPTKSKFDHIKRKVHFFETEIKIPIFAIFALCRNCFMKPHTKMWQMIKYYYKKNNKKIDKYVVIGKAAGEISLNEKNQTFRVVTSDVDRAFAHNIGAEFLQYSVFLTGDIKPVKFRWTSHIIPPEIRRDYINKLAKYCGRDVLVETAERSIFEIIYRRMRKMPESDIYILVVFGSPTCGKTTIAKKILEESERHEWGQNNIFVHVEKSGRHSTHRLIKIGEALLKKRFSVMFDGEYASNTQRAAFRTLAAKFNVNLIYLEINPGIEIAKLFNHVAIELGDNVHKRIRGVDSYYVYRGDYIRPTVASARENYILYHPKIEVSDVLLKYRF